MRMRAERTQGGDGECSFFGLHSLGVLFLGEFIPPDCSGELLEICHQILNVGPFSFSALRREWDEVVS